MWQKYIDTVALVRPSGFTLFRSRAPWRSAAAEAPAKTGVPIEVVLIGTRAGYRDVEGKWDHLRQVDAMRAVLVGPVGHVGWRSRDMPAQFAPVIAEALGGVLRSCVANPRPALGRVPPDGRA